MYQPRRALGSFLAALRQIRGLSRYELAAAMDAKYPYVANIENGHRPLPKSRWPAASAALEIPLETLAAIATAAEFDRLASDESGTLVVAINSAVDSLSPGLQPWQRHSLMAAREQIMMEAASGSHPTDLAQMESMGNLRRRLRTLASNLDTTGMEELVDFAELLLDRQQTRSTESPWLKNF